MSAENDFHNTREIISDIPPEKVWEGIKNTLAERAFFDMSREEEENTSDIAKKLKESGYTFKYDENSRSIIANKTHALAIHTIRPSEVTDISSAISSSCPKNH